MQSFSERICSQVRKEVNRQKEQIQRYVRWWHSKQSVSEEWGSGLEEVMIESDQLGRIAIQSKGRI